MSVLYHSNRIFEPVSLHCSNALKAWLCEATGIILPNYFAVSGISVEIPNLWGIFP
ncbi:hypothetical protein FHX09_002345 [Rhizobium sp. BK538]|nr:hypothetical protein [Rhizobium sp. BK060]MBB4168506.1 hypothetical protein [Rhizobium sp. BK538]TCM79935.1 hypothetical protein EV291_103258 [Rhizobium sp. BK068]